MEKSSYKSSFLSDSHIQCLMSKPRTTLSKVYTNCYLREIVSFTTKMTLETGASLLQDLIWQFVSRSKSHTFKTCSNVMQWHCSKSAAGQYFIFSCYHFVCWVEGVCSRQGQAPRL